MRSSRSHTGPRPFSDFTYIDEDPTNTAVIGIGRLPAKGADTANTATAIANTVADHAAARINSNSAVSTSPLLLTVTGPGNNAYNHHNTIHNTTTTTTATTTTTNDNRSSSNSANPSQTNHTQMPSSNSRDNTTTTITGNSPLLSSNNLALPELTKLVHETSI